MSLTTFLAQGGGGGGGGGGQWMQLVGFLIVVGLSALSWAIQKLNEQREKKRRQDLAERRTLESLRTGRAEPDAPAASAPSPTNRQQELAAKRQAQLEELRRRAAERARQQGQPGSVATRTEAPRPVPAPAPARHGRITQIPGSSGPIVVTPRRPERAAPPPRPAPQPQRRPTAKQRQQPQPQARPRPEPRPHPQPPSTAATTSHGLLSDINTPAVPMQTTGTQPTAARAVAAGQLVPNSPEEWRRALVMREVLSPPLAIRGPGDDPLG